jgi:hypothetical protein
MAGIEPEVTVVAPDEVLEMPGGRYLLIGHAGDGDVEVI